MIDLLPLVTIMAWPVIPLFWIPVHLATNFFRKFGLVAYIMRHNLVPLAYFIRNRSFLLHVKIDMPAVLNAAGIPLLISGTLLHIWTARLLGIRGIMGMPEIFERLKENLVTGGPFSAVRHPTYLAHTLMFFGVFLITGSVSVGIITLIDIVIVNIIIIPLEEKELTKRFGQDYISYKKKVPSRMIPGIHKR
jgi:protein-S-isoprenylcysteine O-methyltransferase Ste14